MWRLTWPAFAQFQCRRSSLWDVLRVHLFARVDLHDLVSQAQTKTNCQLASRPLFINQTPLVPSVQLRLVPLVTSLDVAGLAQIYRAQRAVFSTISAAISQHLIEPFSLPSSITIEPGFMPTRKTANGTGQKAPLVHTPCPCPPACAVRTPARQRTPSAPLSYSFFCAPLALLTELGSPSATP